MVTQTAISPPFLIMTSPGDVIIKKMEARLRSVLSETTLTEGPEEFTCFLSLGSPFETGYVRIDSNKSEFLAFVSSGLVHRVLSVAIWTSAVDLHDL